MSEVELALAVDLGLVLDVFVPFFLGHNEQREVSGIRR